MKKSRNALHLESFFLYLINLVHDTFRTRCREYVVVAIYTSLHGIVCTTHTNMIKLTYVKRVLDSMEGPWPPGLTHLELGASTCASINGLPASLTHLVIGSSTFTSFKGLPASLTHLIMIGSNRLASFEHLPAGLRHFEIHAHFHLDRHNMRSLDLAPLRAATLWGMLEYANLNVMAGEAQEVLWRALRTPAHKRPARVVCVVLSASSVPRVGKRAAVRRLHRGHLVREMAGMLV